MFKKYLNFWVVLSLSLLVFFFVFLHWNSFNAPFERDEGHYAYGAWIMTKGLVPYVNTFEQKPPMIFYPYLLAGLINPDAFWPPRLIAALSLAFTLLLLGLIVGREYGRRAGWITVWLALPMIMFPHLRPFAANTEKFLILPLVGTLAIYVFYRQSPSRWPWFWAGVCGMMAILFKQIAILPVLFIFLIWVMERKDIRGGLSALGGSIATFFLVTGYFFARGGLPGFWEQTIEFNKYYAMSYGGGLTLRWLPAHFQVFFTAWEALFALFVWCLIKRPRRWWFYLGLMFAALLTIFSSPESHYFIMLMPFWAIVSAVSLDSFIDQIIEIIKKPKWQGTVAFTLVFVVVFSIFWPVSRFYLNSPNEIVHRLYGDLNPFIEAPIVAKRVVELASPADCVFIAGSELEILYYAKRLSLSRFTIMYALMMEHPRTLIYQKELVRNLEEHPPKAMVVVRSPLSWMRRNSSPKLVFERLERLLTRYDLIGGTVRVGSKAFWVEPMKRDLIRENSVLLFKRRD